ncbi:NAD(P)/FAD-dependent oxidoreductase [Auritidibacter ignavus]|uniref:NAD(P)/FAD-dependent oxidoreductase n=1 Tax=Auritidibacter ignavus TaxID=678932 RepID=UPI00109CB738|nr:FAD-dependent oxidoreductase [Auritidibacter ignavus]
MKYVIIGGGIAGISLAEELTRRVASNDQVTVVEAEDRLAYHTSSRAAQQLTLSYGPQAVRELTELTVQDLDKRQQGLDEPLMWQSDFLLFGTQDHVVEEMYPGMTPLTHQEVREHAPEIRPESFDDGGLEHRSVRVRALPFLHWLADQAAERGANTVLNARMIRAERVGGLWQLTTEDGQEFVADVVINAAGAWADIVAEAFGARPLGLIPKRRTALEAALATPLTPDHPLVCRAGHDYYYRYDELGIVASPGEDEPWHAEDAQPRDADVQRLIDRIQTETTLEITEVIRSWCGLRTEGPDGEPVNGFDPQVPGFFWLAGQSGYGFQTSLAMATLATDLLIDRTAGNWVSADAVARVSPDRFYQQG